MKKCITTIYYLIDNFCKIYQEWEGKKLLPCDRKRQRQGSLDLCELLTIVIYFYLSPCKDFKNYYLYHLSYKYIGYFDLPSYSRIIQLWPRLILPLALLMQLLKGEDTGIYFIDSSKLVICHNKRTGSNKVFGDKAYISKDLFNKLFVKSLRLFTSIRKDMKKHLLGIEGKELLKKRSLIESVFNVLKNSMNLEHSRNRSPINFLVHILACVVGYAIKKLSLKLVASANPALCLS